jgi:hypothetical protein
MTLMFSFGRWMKEAPRENEEGELRVWRLSEEIPRDDLLTVVERGLGFGAVAYEGL